MTEWKESRMGRPRKYFMDNSKDPDRRKMREIKDLSGWTKEQKDERRRERAALASKLAGEKQRELKPIRQSDARLKTEKEKIEFRKWINVINKERLDNILKDPDKMWEIFGSRGDWSTKEIKEFKAEKRSVGEWVTDKDVQNAMERIYGGKNIPYEDEEENSDEYENPYGELPY